MDDQFLFDDFFVDEEDPGIKVPVTIKGRVVPIYIRPLSTADQISIQAGAITKRFTPEGQVVIDRIDETKGNSLLLAKSIVSWPFVFEDGSPVPVNADNCGRLLGEAGEQITKAMGALNERKAEIISPFENSSDEA